MVRCFYCECYRCTLPHDLSRGFRCPQCYRGVVYAPNPPQEHASSSRDGDRESDENGDRVSDTNRKRASNSNRVRESDRGSDSNRASDGDRVSWSDRRQQSGGYDNTSGVSACAACGLVPTTRWFESAAKVEEHLASWLISLEDKWDAQSAKVRGWRVEAFF